MIVIEKTLKINSGINKVWDKLIDIPFVASCMPGVEKLEAVSDNTYRAVLKVKVAYITASFDVLLTIVKRQEPTYLETVAEGKGRLGAGRVNQKQFVSLSAISEHETVAGYKSELFIVGTLANIGRKAITPKAHEMADQFAKTFAAGCET